MYCVKCGNEIDNNARFCPKCGASAEAKPDCETESNNSAKEGVSVKAELKHSACAAATLTEGEGKRSLLSVIFAACALMLLIIFEIIKGPRILHNVLNTENILIEIFLILRTEIITVIPIVLMLEATLKKSKKKKKIAGIAAMLMTLNLELESAFIINRIERFIGLAEYSVIMIAIIAFHIGFVLSGIGLFVKKKKLSVIGGIIAAIASGIVIIITEMAIKEELFVEIDENIMIMNILKYVFFSLAVIFFQQGKKKKVIEEQIV